MSDPDVVALVLKLHTALDLCHDHLLGFMETGEATVLPSDHEASKGAEEALKASGVWLARHNTAALVPAGSGGSGC